MNSQTQLRLALLACTFLFTTCFVIDDVSGQCWRKHNTVLPQTYPIWTMWNGVDPFQRTYLPDLYTTTSVPCNCASVPAAANVWVSDDSADVGLMTDIPTNSAAPVAPIPDNQDESVNQPDLDASPSDIVIDPPNPPASEAAQETNSESTQLKTQLEEATQRARAAEERAYSAEKSARAAEAAAEKQLVDLRKLLEEAKK